MFSDNEGFVPLKPYNALFEWAAQRLGDEFLGIHIAEKIGMYRLGIYGYLIQNSTSFRDTYQLTERYFPIVQEASSITCQEENGTCLIRYQVFQPDIPSMRQDVEYTLATGILFMRQQLGQDWVPSETFFPTPLQKI